MRDIVGVIEEQRTSELALCLRVAHPIAVTVYSSSNSLSVSLYKPQSQADARGITVDGKKLTGQLLISCSFPMLFLVPSKIKCMIRLLACSDELRGPRTWR